MKNLKRLALSIMLVVSIANVNAQDDNNPWQITVGVNARHKQSQKQRNLPSLCSARNDGKWTRF